MGVLCLPNARAAMLAAVLAGGLMLATAAGTQAATDVAVATSPGDVGAAAMEDPKVCKRIVPTGSRIARRYCLRQSQWEAMREDGQRAARDAFRTESQYGYRGPTPSGPAPR